MNKLQRSILLAGIILLQTLPGKAAESLSVLLQKGIFAEETEGNLDAAIQIYEGIVKEADANRSVVAQAQYRLGVCQLKLGKMNDAEAAFHKLTKHFADQIDVATKAREKLAEMGKSASSVIVRQIWSGPEAAGGISRNGRYLAFIDWNNGNLAVRDMTIGQTRRLTDRGSWKSPVAFAETCAIAPDGKNVAFSWYDEKDVAKGGVLFLRT